MCGVYQVCSQCVMCADERDQWLRHACSVDYYRGMCVACELCANDM